MPRMDDLSKGMSQNVSETVEKVLKGAQYPASKQDLVTIAQKNRAPDPILNKIRSLPGDQFKGPQDVINAVERTR
jgi:hypothetical protein